MSETIVITGAPGNIGSEVINALRARGVNPAHVRVAARDLEKAQQILGNDLAYSKFDFLDPSTFIPSFTDARRLFLVRPPQLGNVPKEIAPAVNAAITAGVKQIVFLSIQGVEAMPFVPHARIEKLVTESAIDHVFLRAGFFMQNLTTVHLAEIRDEHEIALPMGSAKTAFVDARDLGAAGARVLVDPPDARAAYTLTGSEALDYDQVVAILSRELGRTIRYRRMTPPGFFLRQLRKSGLGFAAVTTMLYTLTRGGNAKDVTDDLPRLIERAPITMAQFAHDYRKMWEKKN